MGIWSVHQMSYVETPSGETTLGHNSPERHDLGSVETNTSHERKTVESSQWPWTCFDGTDCKSIHQTMLTQWRQQHQLHRTWKPLQERRHNLLHNEHAWDCQSQKPREHHRCRKREPTVPVTTTVETMATTTPTARALVERVGDEAGEGLQPVQMRRIAALMAECEDACTSEAIAEARRIHLEKFTKVKGAVVKFVPRTDATTKSLTGRWVDTMHDYEQILNGNEDFFSATPAMMHLKMMLVEAALTGHVAAIGDCCGAF